MSSPTGATLAGLKVAVTRSGDDARERLSTLLAERGATPIRVPLTETRPPSDPEALAQAVRSLAGYDWLVLTSARAAGPLERALEEAGQSVKAVRESGVKVCAVGPRTADALHALGLEPDLVPERFQAEGVVEALAAAGASAPQRLLFPRAEGGRDVIPRRLEGAGMRIDVVTAYRTVTLPSAARRLWGLVTDDELDALTFTAGSAVRAFAEGRPGSEGSTLARRVPVARVPDRIGVIALGPATAGVLEEVGIEVHGVANPHTLEGMIEALELWAHAREPLA